MSTSPWDMALHSPRCQRSPSSAVPSVPWGPSTHRSPPALLPAWLSHSGGTCAIVGQRPFVLRDTVSSMATSRSQELAALGETELSDQSNQ